MSPPSNDPMRDIEFIGELPTLTDPVLVVMLQGWIDAAGSAQAAMSAIEGQIDPIPVASFDPDVFIDYRARRPTMQLREGRNESIEFPSIDLYGGHDLDGRDVLILTGHEPDSAWNRFSAATRELCVRLGVTSMVGLGAYPFPTPHTRASRLSCTTPSLELLQKMPFTRSSLDVPAGMAAVLEQVLTDAGIPSIGLWAQVPNYVPAMSYPQASVALIDGLQVVAGLRFDRRALQQEALIQSSRLDTLVRRNDEHVEMVHKLEVAYDEAYGTDGSSDTGEAAAFTESDLPTAEELSAEVERFLRDANPD